MTCARTRPPPIDDGQAILPQGKSSEQRTTYFNGDHVSAQRKGVNLPDRFDQVQMMAQMQNTIDFPPAPKLDPFNRLNPAKATPVELAGERMFMGKGRCAECHLPETSFLDNEMHDLKLERFYKTGGQRPRYAAGWSNRDIYVARCADQSVCKIIPNNNQYWKCRRSWCSFASTRQDRAEGPR
jgi:hypothetical protein